MYGHRLLLPACARKSQTSIGARRLMRRFLREDRKFRHDAMITAGRCRLRSLPCLVSNKSLTFSHRFRAVSHIFCWGERGQIQAFNLGGSLGDGSPPAGPGAEPR